MHASWVEKLLSFVFRIPSLEAARPPGGLVGHDLVVEELVKFTAYIMKGASSFIHKPPPLQRERVMLTKVSPIMKDLAVPEVSLSPSGN